MQEATYARFAPLSLPWLVVLGVLACGNTVRDDGEAEGINPTTLPDEPTSTEAAAGDDGVKLDVATNADDPMEPGCSEDGGGPTGEASFSYIWIANSPEGTVSKIDTRSGEELARYFTGPGNGQDDPSRTSVGLAGDVAVTNRAGSITKIAAHLERCDDHNQDGEIQTSSGSDDVLPWGSDECVLWNTTLAPGGLGNMQGPRPTAWDAGPQQTVCNTSDDRVWVGWYDLNATAGEFRRLRGTDGSFLEGVSVPGWETLPFTPIGPYGGAVDSDGNLWSTGLGGPLVRIDAVSLEVSVWPTPAGASPYGIAVDADGHPWLAGLFGTVVHFDPSTEKFDNIGVGGQLRGLQVDRQGRAWVAKNDPCGLVQIDAVTKSIVDGGIQLPGCDTPVGVSVDVDGFVWVPDEQANLAFRFDPASGDVRTTTGLLGPYTYSDMTGSGLQLVTFPPQG